jgi:FlaA1/EpsC-like NDP-sugar epimerase
MTQALTTRLLALPRRVKLAILLLTDLSIIQFSLWAAFALRLDSLAVPLEPLRHLSWLAPLLAFPVFIRLGLYRAVMRYIGLHALTAIGRAVFLYAVMLAAAIYLLGIPGVPRSIAPIHGLLVLLMIGGSRALARHWLAGRSALTPGVDRRRRVAIYGAGSAGAQLASALAHSRELLPVAMLDDDPALHGRQIGALRVYAPQKLPELIERLDIAEVLLAIPSVNRQRRNEILVQLEPLPVHVRTLPGVAELAQGKVAVGELREIDIEDLLGRDPVAPDRKLLGARIVGKSVMVTGAGGSIGAELCRQILALAPTRIVLYELSEYALYVIEQELLSIKRHHPELGAAIVPLLGSVCDQARLELAMHRFGIQTVFHAAAYKHVPMVEKNPGAGVVNNVVGTWRAANAALAVGVETFVLISTDKAVRPTNTMGATKRLAEMTLQALAAANPDTTRFTMVRFGNVLGSSGSVIPLFREQIRRGGPITVTDPRIVRYFMTIPEAAQLVIQAGAMGNGGEVFVLDMGEPVKILDLARRMIQLSGLSSKDENNPGGDIEITFTGLRPGEKLYEELLIGDDAMPTGHPRIRHAKESFPRWEELAPILSALEHAGRENDGERVRSLLTHCLPEFLPQCGNIDLLTA